jgi:hypothetical protein
MKFIGVFFLLIVLAIGWLFWIEYQDILSHPKSDGWKQVPDGTILYYYTVGKVLVPAYMTHYHWEKNGRPE